MKKEYKKILKTILAISMMILISSTFTGCQKQVNEMINTKEKIIVGMSSINENVPKNRKH